MCGRAEPNTGLPTGVCVVTHPLSASGENATRTLLDILSTLVPVSLVTADLPGSSLIRDEHEVIEISEVGVNDNIVRAGIEFLVNQLRMCAVLARRDEEVVLFFGATSYLLPIMFARALGMTVLVEPRGDVPLTLRMTWEQQMPNGLAQLLAGGVRFLERTGFVVAHGIVTYTPSMAEQLGLDPNAPKVYPNGARYVDTERFSVEVPYEERENIVGFLGRLDEEKGIRELAEVAKRLPSSVTFRFVGDGDLREWLELELAEEIDAGQVEITGWVDHDDVPAELNRMRLLVMLSSPTEGLPTTILEAMACGTPVYATPVSGIPDVVQDGETGRLMHSLDPLSIVEDISEIVSNRIEGAALSKRCRERVEREYSFRTAVDRYSAILVELD